MVEHGVGERDRQDLLRAEADRVREQLRVVHHRHLEHAHTDAVGRDAEPNAAPRQLVLGEEALESLRERLGVANLAGRRRCPRSSGVRASWSSSAEPLLLTSAAASCEEPMRSPTTFSIGSAGPPISSAPFFGAPPATSACSPRASRLRRAQLLLPEGLARLLRRFAAAGSEALSACGFGFEPRPSCFFQKGCPGCFGALATSAFGFELRPRLSFFFQNGCERGCGVWSTAELSACATSASRFVPLPMLSAFFQYGCDGCSRGACSTAAFGFEPRPRLSSLFQIGCERCFATRAALGFVLRPGRSSLSQNGRLPAAVVS